MPLTIIDRGSLGKSPEAPKHRALRKYHSALGNRDAEPVDVMFACGDSLFTNLITKFANRIDQKFAKYARAANPQVAAGGPGMLSVVTATGTAGLALPDAPQGGTPNFVYSPSNGFPSPGPDSAMTFLVGASGTRSWTFTGTGGDLYVLLTAAASATYNVKVDGTNYGVITGVAPDYTIGAGAGTLSQSLGTVSQIGRLKIRGLTAGVHTVLVTAVTGTMICNGFFAYNGDETSGIRVLNQTYPGRGTTNFVGAGTPGAAPSNEYPAGGISGNGNNSEQWLMVIRKGFYLPKLVFLDNYANDYCGTPGDICSVAQNYANHMSIIAQIKAAVVAGCTAQGIATYIPSFVEIPCHCLVTSNIGGPSGNGGTMVDLWQNYVNNAYKVAKNDPDGAVTVFDLGSRMQVPTNTFANSTPINEVFKTNI